MKSFLSFFFASAALASNLLEVTVANGTIRGNDCPSSPASQFQSIPFAKPPVGNLRFAPPEAYDSKYNGILNGAKKTPTCVQFGTVFTEPPPWSEDCLYLDVWVPPNTTKASELPVKVWIYGGVGLAGGVSDPSYNGCNLATDSIVVSVNYRLGPLGFLALDKAGVAGNMAIQDVQLALRWVQENIASFGGDPSKVLVFGQSEGAQIAYILSTLPNARDSMRAIAGESGVGHDYLPSKSKRIQSFAVKWARTLGCKPSDLACLRSKTTAQLNASLPIFPGAHNDNNAVVTSFQPVIDGNIILAAPVKAGSRVPGILGHTQHEGNLFMLDSYPFPPSKANYTQYVTSNFGPSASAVEKAYPISKFNDTPYPTFYAMAQIMTDYSFACPTYRALASAQRNGVPVWTYAWDKEPTCPWSADVPKSPEIRALLNATHTSEIPFVFANTNDLPRPDGTCDLSAYEKQLSKLAVGAWTSMAKRGIASTNSLTWPRFTVDKTTSWNVGNHSYTIAPQNFTSCTEFWNRIDPYILSGTTPPKDLFTES